MLAERYRHACRHDSADWEVTKIRGHDARSGLVHWYEQVLCPKCEPLRQAARARKEKKRQNL